MAITKTTNRNARENLPSSTTTIAISKPLGGISHKNPSQSLKEFKTHASEILARSSQNLLPTTFKIYRQSFLQNILT